MSKGRGRGRTTTASTRTRTSQHGRRRRRGRREGSSPEGERKQKKRNRNSSPHPIGCRMLRLNCWSWRRERLKNEEKELCVRADTNTHAGMHARTNGRWHAPRITRARVRRHTLNARRAAAQARSERRRPWMGTELVVPKREKSPPKACSMCSYLIPGTWWCRDKYI